MDLALPVSRSGAAPETHAFISYSSVDRAASTAVRDCLEGNGIGCWMAPRDIAAGQAYPDAIMNGLRTARLVVLVLSRNASTSPHVQREVERAVSLGRPILPLRIDDSEITPFFEYLIGATQWIETADPPTDASLLRLVSSARDALAVSPGV
jgi:hypothetical protein